MKIYSVIAITNLKINENLLYNVDVNFLRFNC